MGIFPVMLFIAVMPKLVFPVVNQSNSTHLNNSFYWKPFWIKVKKILMCKENKSSKGMTICL